MSNINELLKIVSDELSFDNTGHGVSHSKRVLKNALIISKDLNINEELLTVSSIVHDYIDHKLFKNQDAQIEKLKNKLSSLNYDNSFIDQVLNIILNISFSKGKIPSTLEGKIVQDADRLDSLGAIGVARTFQYGAINNRNMYDDSENCTIAHFYDKLFRLEKTMNTDKAKALARVKTEFMHKFVDKFMDEWV